MTQYLQTGEKMTNYLKHIKTGEVFTEEHVLKAIENALTQRRTNGYSEEECEQKRWQWLSKFIDVYPVVDNPDFKNPQHWAEFDYDGTPLVKSEIDIHLNECAYRHYQSCQNLGFYG